MSNDERKGVSTMLNYRQERFCLYYAQSGDAYESYKKAGYNNKTEESARAAAYRLVTKPFIKERLKELADQAAAEEIANIREVQAKLTTILRGETTDDVVVVEGYGEGCSEAVIKKVRTATRDIIKAGVELAKMQGGYDSKLQVEMTIPVFGGEDSLED